METIDAESPRIDEELELKGELIKRGAVKKAVDRLMEALDATTPQGWPDYRNRIDSATKIMDRVDGKPVERKEQKNINVQLAPSMEQLMQSPAAREELIAGLTASADGRKLLAEALTRPAA